LNFSNKERDVQTYSERSGIDPCSMLQKMVRLPRMPPGIGGSRDYEEPRNYPSLQKVQKSLP